MLPFSTIEPPDTMDTEAHMMMMTTMITIILSLASLFGVIIKSSIDSVAITTATYKVVSFHASDVDIWLPVQLRIRHIADPFLRASPRWPSCHDDDSLPEEVDDSTYPWQQILDEGDGLKSHVVEWQNGIP